MVDCNTLYSPPSYQRTLRVQLAAAYSNSPLKIVEYCPNVSTNLPSALKTCPTDVAPLFLGKDGTILFDANAIAYLLGTKQLRGGESEHYVTQWANFADHILMPSLASWLYPIIGATPYNKQQALKAEENIKKAMKFLDEYLSKRTYFVSESITQADLTTFCVLNLLYANLFDEKLRSLYPNVTRWFMTVANQPEVMKVCGDIKLCITPAVYDPKKQTKSETKKSSESKQQNKPKEEKKKEESIKGDVDFEDETPKPSKNPFALLPVGTFVYDDFKKVYSNEDIKTKAIPYFWDHFDPKTDSIWFCEYNYPEELTLIFMSANLIRGMFQRLERMQKYAFGVMNIFGENRKSTISGIWVWRGTELAFDLSPDLQTDYESYTWKKLDHSSQETKELIEEYFSREGNFGGKQLAEAAVFK